MCYEQHHCNFFIKKRQVCILPLNIIFLSLPLWAEVPTSEFAYTEAQTSCNPSSSVSCVSSLHPAQTPSGIKMVSVVRYLWNGMMWAQSFPASCFASSLCKTRCYAGVSSEAAQAVTVQPSGTAALWVLRYQGSCKWESGGQMQYHFPAKSLGSRLFTKAKWCRGLWDCVVAAHT